MLRKRQKYINTFSSKSESTGESELNKIGNHLSVILTHIIFLFSVALLLSPMIAYFLVGSVGVIACLAVILITSPMTLIAFKRYKELSISQIYQSVIYLAKNSWIQRIMISVLNVFIFLKIGMQTMIPTLILLLTYFIIIVFSIILFYFKNTNYKKTISFIAIPLAINILLVLNYTISFNETKESYHFSHNYEMVPNRYKISINSKSQISSLITLQYNKYKNYYGIRVYASITEVAWARNITFTFKTGILGIRVVKDYKFN